MAFFLLCLLGLTLGRKLGWVLCRSLLYQSGWAVVVFVCLVWGIGLAYAFHFLIVTFHPGLLLRILGYGAAMYVSIPNYGLLNEASIPADQLPRHTFIKIVPWVLFIAASILFAYAIR
jgi:hypothetical protein